MGWRGGVCYFREAPASPGSTLPGPRRGAPGGARGAQRLRAPSGSPTRSLPWPCRLAQGPSGKLDLKADNF